MRIEEFLQSNLNSITDTFKDVVPKDFSKENVIRYSIPDTSSSLFGDDKTLSKTRHVQIDLYTNKKNYELEDSLEEFFDENYLRIVNEQEKKESGKNRKIYFINIEE